MWQLSSDIKDSWVDGHINDLFRRDDDESTAKECFLYRVLCGFAEYEEWFVFPLFCEGGRYRTIWNGKEPVRVCDRVDHGAYGDGKVRD